MYPLVAYFTRLFVLVQVFLLLGTVGFSQSANFSFTEIPYSQAEVIAPGRGVEQWHDQNHVNVPVEGNNTQRIDKYYRFIWSELEVGNRQYDWRYFDSEIRNAISKGQKFSFGIMSHNASANAQTRGIVNTGDGRL